MSLSPTLLNELQLLLDGVCEDRLSDAEQARLQQLLLASAEARAYYLQYIDLHGALYWDTALAAHPEDDAVSALVDATIMRLAQPQPLVTSNESRPARSPVRTPWVQRVCVSVAAGLILAVGIWIGNSTAQGPAVAAHNVPQPDVSTPALNHPAITPEVTEPGDVAQAGPHKFSQDDVRLASQSPPAGPMPQVDPSAVPLDDASAIAATPPEKKPFVPVRSNTAGSGVASSATVLAFINEQLQTGWKQNGVTPSPRADDADVG
ncbi:MAG: hypothetical protein V4719_13355, partial [Planctomycetota bacterium]